MVCAKMRVIKISSITRSNNMKTSSELQQFLFGIYPGGELGSDEGILTGSPDDPVQIEKSLKEMQGRAVRPLIIRSYERFCDTDASVMRKPQTYTQYIKDGRRLDLVAMFQSECGDVEGYLEYVRVLIRQHGETLYAIQITEEANFTDGPAIIDGPYPNVREALVQGVIVAKEEAHRLGYNVQVGFNSTPTFGPATEFWSSIAALGGEQFITALDYVGLDFFPDVFVPVTADGEAGNLRESVIGLLDAMRNTWLPLAGIAPSTPIHITEHGWPTGLGRTEERQNIVIETVIRTLHEIRERLNITRYMMFDLRDADSSKTDFFYQFGLLHDDYTAKLAFTTFCKLIDELSS
jgi:hypothetical protein